MASHRGRGAPDRLLELKVAGVRVGYASEYLRWMTFQDPDNAPPLFKVRGRWKVWLSDLDAWAASQGLPVHELPEERAS
jgi:hypothetical protein